MEQLVIPNVLSGDQVVELQLPPEPNAWSQIILEHFTKKFPFLSQYPLDLRFYKVDGEKGYAIGSIIVTSEDNKISIPILIKNFKLLPIDLMILPDNEVTLLDEQDAIQYLEGPRVFKQLARIPQPADTATVNPAVANTTAPQANILPKMASLASYNKVQYLKNLFQKFKDEAESLCYHHPIFKEAYDYIINLEVPKPEEEIEAIESEMHRNVFQISKHASKPNTYIVKASNSEVWNAIEFESDHTFLTKVAALLNVDSRKFIDFVNKNNTVTVSLNPKLPAEIKKEACLELNIANLPGKTYATIRKDNNQKIFGNIYKMIDGTYCFLNSMGYVAFSANGFKVLGHLKYYYPMLPNQGVLPGEEYIFVHEDSKTAIGPVVIVKKEIVNRDGCLCENYVGKTPNGLDVIIKNDGEKDNITTEITDHEIKVYAGNLLPVRITQLIEIPTADEDWMLKYAGKGVKITYLKDSDEFLFEGIPNLESLSFHKEGKAINLGKDGRFKIDEAVFLLSHCYSPKDSFKVLKAAMKSPVWVENFKLPYISVKDIYNKNLKKASAIWDKFKNIKTDWRTIKIAAMTDDEPTIDAVLSLNLVSPENFAILVQNIPLLEKTLRNVAKMLFMSRLGVLDFPDTELKELLVRLRNLLQELKTIQFELASQQPAQ